jgi:hypothetical protein
VTSPVIATPLDGARLWISRGFHCAPVAPGKKAPPLVMDWEAAATTDLAQVQRWAAEYPRCNWLCAPARSGHVVLDLDRKNGKDGVRELEKLAAQHGFEVFNTLTVSTPSGGLHLYLTGVLPNSASRIAPGIDVRGVGGYVLVPGSRLDD